MNSRKKNSILYVFHWIYAVITIIAALLYCLYAAYDVGPFAELPASWAMLVIAGLVMSGVYSIGVASLIDEVYETAARVRDIQERLKPRAVDRKSEARPAVECPQCTASIAQCRLVVGDNKCPDCGFVFEVETAAR